MKRFLKLLYPIIAIPIAIGLVLTIALFTIFPQAEIRKVVSQRISESIHRQVEIGPLHFRWNGLTIDTLRVSEVPSFASAGTLCDAKGVRLGWDLLAHLRGIDLKHRTLTRSSGSFFIKEFRNPNYIANDFALNWSLRDIDSTLGRLNGSATLKQGAGTVKDLEKLVAKTPAAKAVLTPVLALLTLQRTGVINLGIPDLRYWPLAGIEGNYKFNNGVATIRKFDIRSEQMNIVTTGTVALASGALALKVHVQVPRSMDAQLEVTGTTSKPHVDLGNLKKKAFKATINKTLDGSKGLKKDVDGTLNKLFR